MTLNDPNNRRKMREEWWVYEKGQALTAYQIYRSRNPEAIGIEMHCNRCPFDVEAVRAAKDIVIYANASFDELARLDLYRYNYNTIIIADREVWDWYDSRPGDEQARDGEQHVTVTFGGGYVHVRESRSPDARTDLSVRRCGIEEHTLEELEHDLACAPKRPE